MNIIEQLYWKTSQTFSPVSANCLLLRLGRIKHANKLFSEVRNYIKEHRDWSKYNGGFLYQGRTRLPFCAVLGPVFTIESRIKRYARLRTILIQYDSGSYVEAFALPVNKGIKWLAGKLQLDKEETDAFIAMLYAGKEVLSGYEMQIDYIPWEQTAILLQAEVCSNTCTEKQALRVLEHLGQTGRELFLAGLFSQISVFCSAELRPCLMVRVLGRNQDLDAIRTLLGAINFSCRITGEGTAPPIIEASENSWPPEYSGLALYHLAGKRKDLFLSELEYHQQILTHSETVPCPFPVVPIVLTEYCALRGYVWNIELRGQLPELSCAEQDILRAVSKTILTKAEQFLTNVLQAVSYAVRAPEAYRTTAITRWRQAIVLQVIRTVFPSGVRSEQVRQLFCSDAEKTEIQMSQQRAQIKRALQKLDDPTAYGKAGIVMCPNKREDAIEQLETAFAFYYQPSPNKTGHVGPFLCFSENSFQRFLLRNEVPGNLLQEILTVLKDTGRIREKSEPIHFKKGAPKRFLKLDIGAIPEFLTTERCER